MGRPELGKQCQRPLEVADRALVIRFRGRDSPEADAGRRFSRRVADERVEQRLAALELAALEQRLRQPHPGRKEVRPRLERTRQPRGRLAVPPEPLQHDRIEVSPVERTRLQRLGAEIGLVGTLPLLPRLQHAAKCARGSAVTLARDRCALCCRDGLPGSGRKRIGSDHRQRRDGLSGTDADHDHHDREEHVAIMRWERGDMAYLCGWPGASAGLPLDGCSLLPSGTSTGSLSNATSRCSRSCSRRHRSASSS